LSRSRTDSQPGEPRSSGGVVGRSSTMLRAITVSARCGSLKLKCTVRLPK
jgi:hypothetical protein